MNEDKRVVRVGFLASHNGTAIRAILEKSEASTVQILPVVLITNNTAPPCREIAEELGFPSYVINKASVGEGLIDLNIRDCLIKHKAEYVVLAGYMKKLGLETLKAYPEKILNSHPALLPKFGGQGMYGHFVHDAVIAAQELETGVTIHFASEEYDTGPVIYRERIPVLENETADSLAERVKQLEPYAYIRAIEKLVTMGTS